MEEIRDYLLREINQNELMNKKHKNVCRVFNYIEHLLLLTSTVTGCVSISAFASFSWYCYKNNKFYNRVTILCNKCGD